MTDQRIVLRGAEAVEAARDYWATRIAAQERIESAVAASCVDKDSDLSVLEVPGEQ